MDEMSNKMKGLMKNAKIPFSSSSGKFKGSGRVLGSSSPSPSQPSSSSMNSNNISSKANTISDQKLEAKKTETQVNFNPNQNLENGFDPFNSLMTSGKRNPNGYSLKGFECPVCGQIYDSEEGVVAHVESCLGQEGSESGNKQIDDVENRLQACVSAYLSGKPTDNEVMVRLLKNVVKDPENAKFRKIRLGNPKIKEAIGDVPGGVELLEFLGFVFVEESGEMWLAMEVPSEEQIGLVKNVVLLMEPKKTQEVSSSAQTKTEEPVKPKSIDRQVRVFFSVPEKVAAKIVLPDSFYNLSAEEIKREAETRRKKLEDSKLLIPKSYREKQAQTARKRYKRTVIRIQFPDGVILQALFSPSERTGALYEFVSSALKEPSLEFELLDPVLVKRRVIPHTPAAGKRAVTLAEEDLVPSALIKFKPIETDTVVFTGLCNELLEIIEPLVPDSAVPTL